MKPPFPLLKKRNHKVTSPATTEYNCIAWAAGETDAWWWPDRAQTYFWPQDVPREETLEAFIKAYESLGYATCGDNGIDKGYEKIAIYADGARPTHAARQLKNGRWTSKLGTEHDIEHELGAIEGPAYGRVAVYMRRLTT